MSDFQIKGRTINGDVSRGHTSRIEQLGPADFLDAIDTLLDTEGVEAVVWNQYTPYFNDGDACEFGVNEASVILTFGDEEHEDDWCREGAYSESDLAPYGAHVEYRRDLSWGNPEYDRWRKAYYSDDNRKYEVNGHNTEDIFKALDAFNNKIGAFEYVLKDNFGDHAEVRATKAGFNVEYYDHD